MNNFRHKLNAIASKSFARLQLDPHQAFFTLSQRPELSDFQCNAALSLAKDKGINPRQIASQIGAELERDFAINEITAQISVDGPGFVNVKLSDSTVSSALMSFDPAEPNSNDHLQTIIIDYGGPNIAKALHVGHIRTSIVGESIKRILRAQGHKVYGDIHWGDWGTQMGILLAYLKQEHPDWPYFSNDQGQPADTEGHSINLTLDDFSRIYPEGAARFKANPSFADSARSMVRALQGGHPGCLALWKQLVEVTEPSVKADLSRLHVDFDLWYGESSVNDEIPEMLAELKNRELVMEHDGALIFPVARESDTHEVPPLILEKSGGDETEAGGYTYATTDLATIRMRMRKYHPDKILYVIDTRQYLHCMQVFRAAVAAGYCTEDQCEFLGIGTINGKDGKPFKTRQGSVMRLTQLLDLAYDAAAKKSGVAPNAHDPTVEAISVAALKFQDLRINRAASYNFDPDAATQHEGKTGPYIQYGAARIYSILDKAAQRGFTCDDDGDSKDGLADDKADGKADDKDRRIEISTQEERALAVKLLGYPDVLADAASHRAPSDICTYVYETVQAFSNFYQNCPVLSSEVPAYIRANRLHLLSKTLAVLKSCADLLGFELPKRIPGSAQQD